MARSRSISDDIDQLSLERSLNSRTSETPLRSMANVVDFEMPKALRRPRDVSYSDTDDIKRGLIDVNPEYQRDIVWKPEKQMMLIDSVFTNHYMPPIIFSVVYDDGGTETRKVCLDGKQRLTSIQLFMDGIIPLKHPETSKNWWFKVDDSSVSRTTKNILPERICTSFVNRQIRCTEYEELDDEDEREIFRRVQLGMALSSAEKLRVLNTRRAKFINELKELYVTEHALAAPSFRWERSRGADYRCLAQAVYVISKWGSERGSALKNAGTLPQVEKWLEEDTDPVSDEFASVIKETFAILVELTATEEYCKPFSMYPKVSPVEIIGVLLLIYAHSVVVPRAEKLNHSELSAAISKMRQEVRQEHKDIRLNDRVGKTIVSFVKAYRKPAPLLVEALQASRPLSIAELTYPQPMTPPTMAIPPHLYTTQPPMYSPKRKRELYIAEERAAKRPMVEASSSPVNPYLFTTTPTGALLPSPPSASSHASLVRVSQAPFQVQQQFVVSSPGCGYPGAFVHRFPSQYHSPRSSTTASLSRSEVSSSSPGGSSEYGDEPALVYPPIAVKTEPSLSPSLDALKQLQQLNILGQQAVMDRRPLGVPPVGPDGQSSIAESK